MPGVHQPCLARLLGRDPRRIDRDQPLPIGRLRAWRAPPSTARTGLRGDRIGARILISGQRQLAPERGLDPLRQRQPVCARRRLQTAG